jgi:FAD/FMN-containing dehydrogenase
VNIERLPREAFAQVTARQPSDDLVRAIRAKFDPRGIMNRGIFGAAA